jgi:parallel beta-helix repeat protein
MGIYLGWDSTENLVTANLVFRNGETGIALYRAVDNTVTRNVSCANAIWDASQDAGSGNVWTANAFCTTTGI